MRRSGRSLRSGDIAREARSRGAQQGRPIPGRETLKGRLPAASPGHREPGLADPLTEVRRLEELEQAVRQGLRLTAPEPEALADGLLELLQAPDLCERIRKTGLAVARGRSWEASLQRLASGYRSALLRAPA